MPLITSLRGRKINSRVHGSWMAFSLAIVLLLPVLIAAGLLVKSWPLFEAGSLPGLLFGSSWKPMAGTFGFFPFIMSSVIITFFATIIGGSISLMAAIYITQYASPRLAKVVQPVIDILAGIPSVVYGVWGIIAVVPLVSGTVAPLFGISSTGYCAFSAIVVLSVMIIPFILNVLIEIFKTIPLSLTEASLSLGTTRWQTVKYVILRKAFPGIVSALALGVARAFGETIAVLMVAGNVVNTPWNIFDPAYPLPALIANNYGEMMSIPKYDAALMFAALLLFVVVVIFNLFARILIIRLENDQ